ncbi:MULE domain-containing protein [Aphis craccivora]|uniref:MULE domain-containing protein n=1 Tax=Aphis craccivora TaxID=307492 RepID=A0A6G0Y933_APHCR|nr:MULE domain-containing protein [Aphis craccivora]
MTKICSISKGINKNIVLSDLRRIKASIKMYDEYKIDKNIMVYLSKIGSIYQGKHLF